MRDAQRNRNRYVLVGVAQSKDDETDTKCETFRSRAEVSARPVLIRVRKSTNVGGDRDLQRGLKLPRCFIPVGGELVSTHDLTLGVPRDIVESYGGRAAAAAWGEGVARHTTLMGVELGSVIPSHLHLGCLISCRPSPSG
ncbi:hypothetical protein B296_00027905 [Ensete ventricosum]|uniref:Uncharacterized protein n=1 Tax=Ensete ventricosum TaxID=4639 RepID=A0A426YCS5_ENSVE|nr:hypothetical protein B296_00027905 [Ensete ventricosum]